MSCPHLFAKLLNDTVDTLLKIETALNNQDYKFAVVVYRSYLHAYKAWAVYSEDHNMHYQAILELVLNREQQVLPRIESESPPDVIRVYRDLPSPYGA